MKKNDIWTFHVDKVGNISIRLANIIETLEIPSAKGKLYIIYRVRFYEVEMFSTSGNDEYGEELIGYLEVRPEVLCWATREEALWNFTKKLLDTTNTLMSYIDFSKRG
jgi:hypothetical protein